MPSFDDDAASDVLSDTQLGSPTAAGAKNNKKSLLYYYAAAEHATIALPLGPERDANNGQQARHAVRHSLVVDPSFANVEDTIRQIPMLAELVPQFENAVQHLSKEGETFFKNTPQGKAHSRHFYVDMDKGIITWTTSKGSKRDPKRCMPFGIVSRVLLFELSAADAKKFKVKTTSSHCSCLVIEGKGRVLELISSGPLRTSVAPLALVTALCANKQQRANQKL